MSYAQVAIGGYALAPYGMVPYGIGGFAAAVASAPHVNVPTNVILANSSSSVRIGG